MNRLPLLAALLAAGCVPHLPEPNDGPVQVDVGFAFEPSTTTRIATWQVDLNTMQWVAERHSEVLDGDGAFSLTVPAQPAELNMDMGGMGALVGDSVLLFVIAHEDVDGSGSYEEGEPIVGLSQRALVQVNSGGWYTLDFGLTMSPVFGDVTDGLQLMDFTEPSGLRLDGGYDATMPPNEAVPLPPANRVATLSSVEPEAYKLYKEAGHPNPPPLPGRPADAAADLETKSWTLELPADPGPVFAAAHIVEVPGFGHLAIEAPVAYLDNGDEQFIPDFSGEPPEFNQFGVPEKDLLLGGICHDNSQLMALYVPTPVTTSEALVTWALFGGNVGWNAVVGLDNPDGPSPRPLAPSELLDLQFSAASCVSE